MEQKKPNGIGVRATITAKLVWLTFSFTSEIVGYEPNHTFAVKADKPFSLVESETFIWQGSSTRIDYQGKFDTSGFFRLMDPLIYRLFKRQLAASFRKLKDVLESEML